MPLKGGEDEGEREGRDVYECVMDKDGGNCVGERRWSGAISVTSHLTAQCFNVRRLVRGQREGEESGALIRADGCGQVASPASELICLCLGSPPEAGRTSSLRYRGIASTRRARGLRVLQNTGTCGSYCPDYGI